MSEATPSEPQPPLPASEEPVVVRQPPPSVLPVRTYRPPSAPQSGSIAFGIIRWLLLITIPVFLAFVFGIMLGWSLSTSDLRTEGGTGVREQYYAGTRNASDKIAIIRVSGIIMEGLLPFPLHQIEEAASDEHVKAVVLRINSPGGSIGASDELHRRLVELRSGTFMLKKTGTKSTPKPLIVSMGSLAASGGYYIAVPGQHLVAEPTTITGSIGVYASFPDVSALKEKIGVDMRIIKQGELKASGSPFHSMTPQEEHLWQDMVDQAYARFLGVIEDGRPELGDYWFSRTLREEIPEETRALSVLATPSSSSKESTEKVSGPVRYVRRRADGGIFTAEKAKKYGLIDQIGYLDDAIQVAKDTAKLTTYEVVTYERPMTLARILGLDSDESAKLDMSRLANLATPRLWYLTPQGELAGFLTAASSR